jgi:hypothetical protein
MKVPLKTSTPILLSSAAVKDKVTDHAVSAPTAKEIQAGWFGTLKADCSAGLPPQTRVIDQARNGVIKLRHAHVRMNSAPHAPMPSCRRSWSAMNRSRASSGPTASCWR